MLKIYIRMLKRPHLSVSVLLTLQFLEVVSHSSDTVSTRKIRIHLVLKKTTGVANFSHLPLPFQKHLQSIICSGEGHIYPCILRCILLEILGLSEIEAA